MAEFNLDLWVAAVDFEKAFDSVKHASFWSALRGQGVPGSYITVMIKLCGDQTRQVVSDRDSEAFPLQRGTKQGGPMSPSLFNAVLEDAMRKLKKQWRAKRCGVKIDG
eukprot:335302-Pyramimonas_sp.AAC.2